MCVSYKFIINIYLLSLMFLCLSCRSWFMVNLVEILDFFYRKIYLKLFMDEILEYVSGF